MNLVAFASRHRVHFLLNAVIFLWLGSGILDVTVAQKWESNWGQWRGPIGTGESPTATPPSQWSETQNVRWKTPLEGLGHGTPVVWGKTVIVTTAIPFGPKFEAIPDNAPGSHDNLKVSQKFKFDVIAINRNDGEIKWQKTLHTAIPHEGSHVSGSLASASPVTDGTHIFAYFGTYGIYCLDFEGNVVWRKSIGTMSTKHAHGEGASPALYGNTLIVNWDHEGDSFILALNKNTGEQIWKVDRKEVTSWSSPIVYQHRDVVQVIVAGTNAVRAYNLEDGKVIWSCGGLSNNIVATPIAHEGVVFVGSSYEIKSMLAIQLDGAQGDISNSQNVVWRRATRTPYVPSPLLYRGSLYFLRHYQGIISIANAKTGEELVGPFRLNGIRDVYASPVAADGKIFITSRDGITLVISEPEMPKLLSANRLDDSFSASLALVDGEIFLRGEKNLYCVAKNQ
ncbi:MAG: PQQ-binding-like beta-propeller repeat protein [Mariniblastus sp.]|nr:PQQ-binding-like beta-propeller repeat protein [Mariniblastus sp.]